MKGKVTGFSEAGFNYFNLGFDNNISKIYYLDLFAIIATPTKIIVPSANKKKLGHPCGFRVSPY